MLSLRDFKIKDFNFMQKKWLIGSAIILFTGYVIVENNPWIIGMDSLYGHSAPQAQSTASRTAPEPQYTPIQTTYSAWTMGRGTFGPLLISRSTLQDLTGQLPFKSGTEGFYTVKPIQETVNGQCHYEWKPGNYCGLAGAAVEAMYEEGGTRFILTFDHNKPNMPCGQQLSDDEKSHEMKLGVVEGATDFSQMIKDNPQGFFAKFPACATTILSQARVIFNKHTHPDFKGITTGLTTVMPGLKMQDFVATYLEKTGLQGHDIQAIKTMPSREIRNYIVEKIPELRISGDRFEGKEMVILRDADGVKYAFGLNYVQDPPGTKPQEIAEITWIGF